MRLLLAAASLLLVAACGTSTPTEPEPSPTTSSAAPTRTTSRPQDAVEGLMRALDRGDCPAARHLVVTPAELGCDLVEQAEGSFADEGVSLDDATYTAGPVEGSSTTVTIDWGDESPGETYDVERVDGTWLVVFDSAA